MNTGLIDHQQPSMMHYHHYPALEEVGQIRPEIYILTRGPRVVTERTSSAHRFLPSRHPFTLS
jgi:hypothetical protein